MFFKENLNGTLRIFLSLLTKLNSIKSKGIIKIIYLVIYLLTLIICTIYIKDLISTIGIKLNPISN